MEAPLARMSKIAPSTDSIGKPLKNSLILPIIEPIKEEEVDSNNPKIPDGGWGWVVVFATFVLCMIADGVTFSFGLLYVEFLKEFKASNSATSWIGSLFMSVPLLTGPIMSGLVDKFGCRSMTIVGGLISATGFILSSQCYSINLMYLTFGIITGLGLGLIYVTVVVSVAFWFDKKRTLAVGIGSAGIGIGTFVFSPLSTYLIERYGWRTSTLILSGFFLLMCVGGALMKDPDWIKEQNRENTKTKSEKSSKVSLASINIEELRTLLTSDQNVEAILKDIESNVESNEDVDKLKHYFQSTLSLPTFVRQHEKVPDEVLQLLSTNKQVLSNAILTNPSLVLTKSQSHDGDLNKQPTAQQDVQTPLLVYRKTSGHEKYFKNLKIDKHSLIHRGALFNTNKYRFKTSSCPNIYRVSMISLPKDDEETWCTELKLILKDMFDFSLFRELHFFLLSLSTITLFTWFIVPYFYLADLMEKSGYAKDKASFTIANIGISNTIGMIFLGWAGDRPWMNITKTYAACLALCGLSVAGQMYFLHNYIMLQVAASLFGLSMSSHFAFTPGIVMELVPMNRFTIAYGLQLLCSGIGTLVGPPYAGLLFDITKKWEQTFYQAAIWLVLSGIFVWIIPYIKNKRMIGKGPVEKDVQSQTGFIPLVLLGCAMLASFAVMFYLTGTAIKIYLN